MIFILFYLIGLVCILLYKKISIKRKLILILILTLLLILFFIFYFFISFDSGLEQRTLDRR